MHLSMGFSSPFLTDMCFWCANTKHNTQVYKKNLWWICSMTSSADISIHLYDHYWRSTCPCHVSVIYSAHCKCSTVAAIWTRGIKSRVLVRTHLVVLVPGERFGCQNEPVLFSATFHDADVVDCQPALPDDLRNKTHRDYKVYTNQHTTLHHLSVTMETDVWRNHLTVRVGKLINTFWPMRFENTVAQRYNIICMATI